MDFLFTLSFGTFYSSEVCHFNIVEFINLAFCMLRNPSLYCDHKCIFLNFVQKFVKSYFSQLEFIYLFLEFLYFYLFIYLFTYFWLCWVFVSVRGLSLVAASGGHSSLWCAGLSLSRPLLLRSTGSRRSGSVVVAHGPSCSTACGILPEQGWNPCPLHWQADSQPLCHQRSPGIYFFDCVF